MRDALAVYDGLHTADGAHAQVAMVSGHTARHGRRYDIYATAAGGVQGLQALSPRHWPPLGAFIKLPALRVVHDFVRDCFKTPGFTTPPQLGTLIVKKWFNVLEAHAGAREGQGSIEVARHAALSWCGPAVKETSRQSREPLARLLWATGMERD